MAVRVFPIQIRHKILVRTVDTEGNSRGVFFPLIEISRRLIGTLSGHSRDVTSVAFSPDGKTLASGSNGGTVKLWDVGTRTNVATLGTGRSVAFSPDGETLALGGTEGGTIGTIQLWNVPAREHITTLRHGSWVESVAFSPDSTTLASGDRGEGTIKLWDVATRELIATLRHAEHRRGAWVESVAFSPDGTTLASGGSGARGAIKLWDVATRELIASLTQIRISDATSVAFSPDGTILASGSGSGYIYELLNLWDVAAKQHIVAFPGGGVSVAFSPDGTILVSGAWDGAIELWNVETRELIGSLAGHIQAVQSVAFSPDGRILASGGEDNTIRLWDVSKYMSVVPPSAGSNADAVLSLDLIADGGAGNQKDDGVASGTVSGQGTKIAVEVFATGVKTPLQGIIVKFDFDSSLVAFDKAENSAFALAIQETDGTNFASTVPVTISSSNFLARAEFTTVADVTGRPFSIGIKVVTLAESETSSDDITTTKVISFNAIPSPATFSLSLDGNTAAGDQAVTTLDVSPGSVVSIQVFGKDIRDANGISARFEYDSTQVVYEGFDPGGVLPNAQVIPVPRTNPTAVEINYGVFWGASRRR